MRVLQQPSSPSASFTAAWWDATVCQLGNDLCVLKWMLAAPGRQVPACCCQSTEGVSEYFYYRSASVPCDCIFFISLSIAFWLLMVKHNMSLVYFTFRRPHILLIFRCFIFHPGLQLCSAISSVIPGKKTLWKTENLALCLQPAAKGLVPRPPEKNWCFVSPSTCLEGDKHRGQSQHLVGRCCH